MPLGSLNKYYVTNLKRHPERQSCESHLKTQRSETCCMDCCSFIITIKGLNVFNQGLKFEQQKQIM